MIKDVNKNTILEEAKKEIEEAEKKEYVEALKHLYKKHNVAKKALKNIENEISQAIKEIEDGTFDASGYR